MITTGTPSWESRPASPSTSSSVTPACRAVVPAAWITGPSASGSENGMPSSSRLPPASTHARAISNEVLRSGKPPIRYGIRAARRPSARAEANASEIRSTPLTASAPLGSRFGPAFFAEQSERLGQILVASPREADEVKLACASREHPGDGMSALERGDDPFQAGARSEGLERLAIRDGLVASPARIPQPCMLGAAAWVVQPRRDRMRLEYLAVLALHERRVGAVQHAGQASRRQRRSMAPGVDAFPRGLDADQLDAVVCDERGEDPDRVRAAPDAGDHAPGEPPGALEHLRSGLVADHPLEIAHQRRERRRPHGRADDVVA